MHKYSDLTDVMLFSFNIGFIQNDVFSYSLL